MAAMCPEALIWGRGGGNSGPSNDEAPRAAPFGGFLGAQRVPPCERLALEPGPCDERGPGFFFWRRRPDTA